MLIAGYAQEVSSTRKDRRNRTHVDYSLTCCSEENSKSYVLNVVLLAVVWGKVPEGSIPYFLKYPNFLKA